MNARKQQEQSTGPARRLRRLGLGLGAAVAVASLAACGQAGTATGDLATGQQVLSTCHGKPVAAMVALDVSGSMAEPKLSTDRQQMVSDAAQRVAVCGGHLQVMVFSTSSARTGVLFDKQLTPAGATENARLRRSMKAAHEAVSEVEKNYAGEPGKLSPDGSDILGTYLLAGEYFSQLGSGYGARIFDLSTDGFATSGVQITGRSMSTAQAKALAAKASVPELPGVDVTVAGLGKVNGTPPDTAIVRGLTWFYDAVCAKTKAASCTSVTDYVGGQK
jgi:hypothetical protein